MTKLTDSKNLSGLSVFFAILLTKLTKNRGSVSFVSSPCLAFVVFSGLDKFTGRGSSFRAEATRNPAGHARGPRPQSGNPRDMRGVRSRNQEPAGHASGCGRNQNPTGHVRDSRQQSEVRGACQAVRGCNRKPAGRPPPHIFMGGSCRRPHMGLSSCGKLC